MKTDVNAKLHQIGYITVRADISCENCGDKPKAAVLHKGKYHIYCRNCFENLKPPKTDDDEQ
jgi:late competence protein required for DNA uptake (superfamily II DNA/RNA helicase)